MSYDLIGRVLKGRYKIIDELRTGDLSTTYIARDIQDNQIRSLKIMHIEFSDDSEFLSRFQKEAHILMRLDNEHIIRAIEYGEDNGIHFILTNYIDGQNIKYLILTSGTVNTLKSFDYAQQVAEALDVFYISGIVHRDIKPQNIVISAKGIAK